MKEIGTFIFIGILLFIGLAAQLLPYLLILFVILVIVLLFL